MMPQILPINLKLHLVIHMHQFVRQRVFHVFLRGEVPGTERDSAEIGRVSA